MSTENTPKKLKQELGLFGAIVMGLGSMIGSGIFVSLGIAAGISGSAVLLAVILAGLLAICNAFNIAQLAASNAVSGGVYEFGYRYLNPWLGFTGGWMYVLAKTAAAATAALGFSGYLLNTLGLGGRGLLVPTALTTVLILTLIVLTGMRRSKTTTAVIVSVSVISLTLLVIAGVFFWPNDGFAHLAFSGFGSGEWTRQMFEASALMFVAYTGYGRLATMGEEVVEPKKNIPKAIIITIFATMALYIAVAVVSLGLIGADAFSEAAIKTAAPLEVVASSLNIPGASKLLTAGALAAMLGVLISATLGLSRMLLAMARRQDMPSFMTKLNSAGTTPYWAVIVVGSAIALLVLIGNVKVTWTFSVFASLHRSLITNLAALKMDDEERMYPMWVTWASIISCVFLSIWVEPQIWLVGSIFIVAGLIWHFVAQSSKSPDYKIPFLSRLSNQVAK